MTTTRGARRAPGPAADLADLRRRVAELETAIAQAGARAAHEAHRADLAERSARRAWELSTWVRPSGDDGEVKGGEPVRR